MSAKIAQALHQVMSSVSYVQKTGNNAFHNYKYASEADLLEKLRPAMLEAGLLLIPSISKVTAVDEHGITTVIMEYTLAHRDGDIWPHKIGAAGQGVDRNKNGVGDKGSSCSRSKPATTPRLIRGMRPRPPSARTRMLRAPRMSTTIFPTIYRPSTSRK